MQSSDGQLLARFLQNKDEFAFGELVKRHSRMVMVVCRRILWDRRDAEEAFQNVFMVLVRKAGLFLQAESVRGWLYHVAVRTAMNIRSSRMAQAARIVEQKNVELAAQQEEDLKEVWAAMKGLLDKELDRLADKYRLPLILCYVEGKNIEQAAADLELNYNTFKSRLARGRELLRKRLVRCGIKVSDGALNAVLLKQAVTSAEVVASEVLIQSSVNAAMAVVSASGIAGGAAAGGLKLLKGVLLAMITMKQTTALIGGLILLGLLGTGALWMSGKVDFQPDRNKSAPAMPMPAVQTVGKNLSPAAKKTEEYKIAVENQITITASISKSKNSEDSEKKPSAPKTVVDYAQNLRKALALSDSNQRWQALRELGINLSDQDFAEAEARFRKTMDSSGYKWTALGRESAFEEGFAAYVMDEWIRKDPASTMNWIKKLTELPAGEGAGSLTMLIYGILGCDPSYNDYLHCDLPSSRSVQCYLSAMLRRWGDIDPQNALAWADNNMSDNKALTEFRAFMKLRDKVGAAASSTEAVALMLEAVDKKEITDLDEGTCAACINSLLTDWAKDDLKGAVEWVICQPMNDLMTIQIISEFLPVWGENDVTGALNWWENYQPVNFKDPGINGWFSERQSIYALSSIIRGWAQRDPRAAQQWFEQWAATVDLNNFDNGEKRQLQNTKTLLLNLTAAQNL